MLSGNWRYRAPTRWLNTSDYRFNLPGVTLPSCSLHFQAAEKPASPSPLLSLGVRGVRTGGMFWFAVDMTTHKSRLDMYHRLSGEGKKGFS